METPVLNKKQQKQSLSAKKSKNKETIKNVLSTPYKNFYWPQTSSEDHNSLNTVLQANLPWIKEKRVSPPYSEIKHLPKEERKKYRIEYTAKVLPDVKPKTCNDGFVLGTNDVTKLLEQNCAGVVIIKDNVNPKLLVQHVIDMCVLYKVPFVVLKDLNVTLSAACGVGSICCAIKRNIPSESKLSFVKEAVENIFEKYPLPTQHVNYNRSIDIVSAEGEVDDIESDNDRKQKIPKLMVDETKIRESVYLKRKTKGERVFVPYDTQSNSKVTKTSNNPDFLSFSEQPPKKSKYIPLVVKRLKGDLNRRKRKLKSLKGNR